MGITKVGDRIRINQSLKGLRIQYPAVTTTATASPKTITSASISSSVLPSMPSASIKYQLRSLEELNRDAISPFATAPPSVKSESTTPIEAYSSSRQGNSGQVSDPGTSATSSSNRFPFRRGITGLIKSPLVPPTTTTTVISKTHQPNNVQEIYSMDVVKQNNLKFIYPEGESKTVNIAGCATAGEIKRKALQKIIPDNLANPVDWIVFVAVDKKYRHLGDAELLSISQSTENQGRRRLMLCAYGTSPSEKQLAKSKQIEINSHLRIPSLTSLSDITAADDGDTSSAFNKSGQEYSSGSTVGRSANPLSLAEGIVSETNYDDNTEENDDDAESIGVVGKARPRKLGRLSENRPPSELISSNLAHYFPSAPANDLEETIRNSRRFSKRMSRMSRISHRMSIASSIWGIPEDEEQPPPLPNLPFSAGSGSDEGTITTSSINFSSSPILTETFTSSVNAPVDNNASSTATSDTKQRPSIRDSIRKSVLPRRQSVPEGSSSTSNTNTNNSNSNGTNVLAALSSRISTSMNLNKTRTKSHDDEDSIGNRNEGETLRAKVKLGDDEKNNEAETENEDAVKTATSTGRASENASSDDEDEDDSAFLAIARREETCPTKWIKGRLIGSGNFGTVYLAMNSFTGELMAVKQVELPSEDSVNGQRKKSMVDALQREMSLLRELHHENIVQYLGSNSEDNFLNIFLEYVPGGSVAMLLSNYGVFEESLIRNFVRQILQGLKYLHDQNIIHRDIKGANVLVDNKGCIKISDFGISKKIETKLLASNRVSLQGSVFWMAPEVVKRTSYTIKADIWSLGCLIVEMFSGTHPFPEFNQMQVIFRLGNSTTPAIPEDCSADAEDFLSKTFAIDYKERPTAAELLRHPFIEPVVP